jgi:hypothetical protein
MKFSRAASAAAVMAAALTAGQVITGTSGRAFADAVTPLDGDYTIEFHVDQRTVNQNPSPGLSYTLRYAFRGACNRDGCRGTGVQLDGSTGATKGDRFSLTYNDSTESWGGSENISEICDDGTPVHAEESWSLHPEADGTWEGGVYQYWKDPCQRTVNIPITPQLMGPVPPGTL